MRIQCVAFVLLVGAASYSWAIDCSAIKVAKERLKCFDIASRDAEIRAIKQKKEDEERVAAEKLEQEKQGLLRQQNENIYKKEVENFLNQRVVSLSTLGLMWSNFMFNPSGGGSSKLTAYLDESKVAAKKEYEQLKSLEGTVASVSDKVKDCYAAWMESTQQIQPKSYETQRGYGARMSDVISRYETLVNRTKLDLH